MASMILRLVKIKKLLTTEIECGWISSFRSEKGYDNNIVIIVLLCYLLQLITYALIYKLNFIIVILYKWHAKKFRVGGEAIKTYMHTQSDRLESR